MAVKKYGLRSNPTVEVEIGGKRYEAALGNLTFVIEAKSLASKMASIGEPGIPADETVARAEDFANSARAMCASMFGEAAAAELLGGPERMNLVRIADVVTIMADIASSDASMEVAKAAISGE